MKIELSTSMMITLIQQLQMSLNFFAFTINFSLKKDLQLVMFDGVIK